MAQRSTTRLKPSRERGLCSNRPIPPPFLQRARFAIPVGSWATRHVRSAAILQAKNEGDGLVCANASGLFVSYRSWHLMECAALASYLVTQSRTTLTSTRFRERRVRPFCHLIVRQQTWREIIIQSAAVAAGLRLWESRMRFPGLASFCQASIAGQLFASQQWEPKCFLTTTSPPWLRPTR